MRAKLTTEETKKLVEVYFSHASSTTQAMWAFNAWAEHNNCPTRVSVKNVVDVMRRFREVREQPRYSVTREETILAGVSNSLYQQRYYSIRKCAAQMDLSVGTVHSIARSVLKLYPYRLILTQKLSEFDKVVRLEACRHLLDVVSDDKTIVYSDECTFYTDEHVSTWNCRI